MQICSRLLFMGSGEWQVKDKMMIKVANRFTGVCVFQDHAKNSIAIIVDPAKYQELMKSKTSSLQLLCVSIQLSEYI